MSEPPVDHVRLADAGTEALQTGFHLRNHAFVNSAALNELPASARIKAAQERTFVFLVLENAGRVGQDDELFGLQLSGDGGGRRVGVDVEPTPVRIQGQRGN